MMLVNSDRHLTIEYEKRKEERVKAFTRFHAHCLRRNSRRGQCLAIDRGELHYSSSLRIAILASSIFCLLPFAFLQCLSY